MGWRSRLRGQIFWRAAFLGSVALLWWASLPPFGALFVLTVGAGGLGLMGGCGIAWIVALVQSARAKTLTSSRVWWFPLMVVVTVGIVGSGAPWHARWAYAQPRFESAIEALPDGNGYIGESAAPREVAGYTISRVERHDDIVLFWVDDLYLFGSGGFGHFPGGPNENELYDLWLLDTPTFTHLHGDWYIFTEHAYFPFDD